MTVKIRVATYNIHKGFDLRQRKFVLNLIKKAIMHAEADILFLQEVVGKHQCQRSQIIGWPLASQFEYLADSVWPHFAYGRNAVYDEGDHGNAILSRFPIVAFSNHDISVPNREARGVLHCRIKIPSFGQLDCFCTHLDYRGSGRSAQLLSLVETVVAERSGPTVPLVLAGDFNDWRGLANSLLAEKLHAREAAMQKHGRLLRTFPSLYPLLALDRIYCVGLDVEEVGLFAGRPWNRLSDHLPVFAQLQLPPPPAP